MTTTAQRQMARDAFSRWAEISNFDFKDVTDLPAEPAQITIAWGQIDGPSPSGLTLGVTTGTPSASRTSPLPIVLDTDECWFQETLAIGSRCHTAKNEDALSVLIHEIGHALGLDHSTLFTAIMYKSIDGCTRAEGLLAKCSKRVLAYDDVAGLYAAYANAWSHMVPAGTDRVLFYNDIIREASIGTPMSGVPTDPTTGSVAMTWRMPPGYFGAWTHVVQTNTSQFFFYNETTRQGQIASLVNGALVSQWLSPVGHFAQWSSVASHAPGQLIFYSRDLGRIQLASIVNGTVSSGWLSATGAIGLWTDLVPYGSNQMFMMDRTSRRGQLVTVTSSGLSVLWQSPAGYFAPWTHVVAYRPSELLFFNRATGVHQLARVSNNALLNGFVSSGATPDKTTLVSPRSGRVLSHTSVTRLYVITDIQDYLSTFSGYWNFSDSTQ